MPTRWLSRPEGIAREGPQPAVNVAEGRPEKQLLLPQGTSGGSRRGRQS